MEKHPTPDLNLEPGRLRLPAGTILQGRYRLVRELGTGGMGAVFEAVDQRLDATVALKQTFSTDDLLRRQFEQEARLLAHLHHPCLPRVTDYFCEAGHAFLVMQFISGPDLAQILSQQPKPFPREQVIAWADQLLDALVYLHKRDRQIIHRDIKPHNLKVTADGRMALLDFGLAKTHSTDQSSTNSSHSIFGYTRRYSPPEQIRDLGTTPQSDIYALGATLYHLLTGVKPPDSLERSAAVSNSEPDPLERAHQLNSTLEPELSAVLNVAMALNPKNRFKDAGEFREALRRVGRKDRNAEDRTAALTEAQTRPALPTKPSTRLDPFDSYSILKPEDEVFRITRAPRRPAFFAVIVAIALVLMVIAFPGRVINSVAGILDSGNAQPSTSLTEAVRLRPKTGSAPVKTAAAKASAGVESEVRERARREEPRREEPRKRRGPQPTGQKPRPVKPPRFSIEP